MDNNVFDNDLKDTTQVGTYTADNIPAKVIALRSNFLLIFYTSNIFYHIQNI